MNSHTSRDGCMPSSLQNGGVITPLSLFSLSLFSDALWRFNRCFISKLIEDFCHDKALELSNWFTLNLSVRAILNIGTSVSNMVSEVAIITRFSKCEVTGLVCILQNFINLEVIILNVIEDVENVETKFEGILEDEGFDETNLLETNRMNILLMVCSNLRTAEIHDILGGSKASCISMDRLSKKKHSLGSDDSDRCICKLPDNLLLRIISLLQMKDRVRTGCLSTRWKNLWKSVSNIDFTQTNMHRTPELIAAIDKTLSYHDGLQVREFHVNAESDLCSMNKVGSWINFVVGHNIEVLYLDLTPHNLEDKYLRLPLIPARVFESKSLTRLTLKFCLIKLPPKFCLASLKTLYFERVAFDNEELASLLGNCPFLKHLTLKNCNRKTALKIDTKNSQLESLDIDEDSDDEADVVPEFEIFAPSLLTLNFFGKPKRSKYVAMNLKSLVSVNFNFLFPSKFSPFWKTQLIIYGKLLEDFWTFIDGFLHAKVLKLSCWCTMSLSFKEILGISGSPSVSVTDLTFETEFWKCNLSGLVYVLRDFSKLEVLTINVMRNHDNKSGDFHKEEKSGINAYWKPDDSSVLGLQQHLKTVKINDFLGSLDTSAEFEMTTESILDARDTEFVFVKFLLKNLTELETMIIAITEELDNFPALKKLDILSQLSSRLLAFPKSSLKAQILIYPDQLTDA